MPLAIEIVESELWVMNENLWMKQLVRGSKEEKVIDEKVHFLMKFKSIYSSLHILLCFLFQVQANITKMNQSKN
jgi:hypothetical protein